MCESDDFWDRWYMAYPATAILIALVYVICFILGLVPILCGWVDPDAFWSMAMTALKYCAAAAGIIGSIWALRDYHVG